MPWLLGRVVLVVPTAERKCADTVYPGFSFANINRSRSQWILFLQTMSRFRELKKLISEGTSQKNALKLIKWLQKKKLIKRKIKCRICHREMKLRKRVNSRDQYAW